MQPVQFQLVEYIFSNFHRHRTVHTDDATPLGLSISSWIKIIDNNQCVIRSCYRSSNSHRTEQPTTYSGWHIAQKPLCNRYGDRSDCCCTAAAAVSACVCVYQSLRDEWLCYSIEPTWNCELITRALTLSLFFLLLLIFPCWTFWPPSINWHTLGEGQTMGRESWDYNKRGMDTDTHKEGYHNHKHW